MNNVVEVGAVRNFSINVEYSGKRALAAGDQDATWSMFPDFFCKYACIAGMKRSNLSSCMILFMILFMI
ncbi:MAG: hypothetical protein ACD_29C00242G0002 [uncultured bacterium]|nr:MAG: hypothetical protein ACD_29C00242G0002 [uncultured bacterium]OGT34522.1 MAG: hypothetical protein A3C44_08180 [Gammaproteobacteria bacterium RIFCSPHIGHO2_02_FULL_39_13]